MVQISSRLLLALAIGTSWSILVSAIAIPSQQAGGAILSYRSYAQLETRNPKKPCDDPKIQALVAEAMRKHGKEGVITVEECNSLAVELQLVEGMQFDKGYLSPHHTDNKAKKHRKREQAERYRRAVEIMPGGGVALL